MKLKVIHSNSAGNCYILEATNGEKLMIDCGVHIDKIKKALGFDYRHVNVIVTHSHNDHAKSLEALLKAGISVYASFATHEATGTDTHHRAHYFLPGVSVQIGDFKVKPFSVNHDVPTLGFLIFHPESGLTLFLTDTFFCDYTFPRLNNIIVECNHEMGLVKNNGTPTFLSDRIIQSHMNLDTCKKLLMANNLTQVNNIVLIHLSDRNSDAKYFKQTITELTGKNVSVAEPGLVIDFNKTAI
jgi:phosphoribosyl 1,2-cyclic phosphodiesterase